MRLPRIAPGAAASLRSITYRSRLGGSGGQMPFSPPNFGGGSGTGGGSRLSAHDVARAIIGEARRRGYSPAPTIAILADAMRESGLNPRGEPKWAVAKHLPAGRQLRGPR
jgi:hypothetical protein